MKSTSSKSLFSTRKAEAELYLESNYMTASRADLSMNDPSMIATYLLCAGGIEALVKSVVSSHHQKPSTRTYNKRCNHPQISIALTQERGLELGQSF
jgi:hypothetical protein